MKTNPILEEIRQTRDELARESGYDLARLFAQAREHERKAAARGVKFVSPTGQHDVLASCLVREEPSKP